MILDIDECNLDPCQNGATCTEGTASFLCTCAPGWTGTTCDEGNYSVHQYMETCIHINCTYSSFFSFLCCMVLEWHCISASWAFDIKCIWCHATLIHYYYQQIQGSSSPLVPWSFECCNCNGQLCFCWMLPVNSFFI